VKSGIASATAKKGKIAFLSKRCSALNQKKYCVAESTLAVELNQNQFERVGLEGKALQDRKPEINVY